MPSSPFQKRILVIKLGALGDFIQSLGPMAAIRKHHADAHITLLTTAPFKILAEQSGYFDSIHLDVRPKWFQFKAWRALKNFLNHGNFARVYDLQNNDRTNIYFKLLFPKPEWVGTAKGASHRNISKQRTSGLAFYGHVQTLNLAGIEDIKIDDLSWITSDVSRFNLQDRYALIIPGSAPNRPEKRWPAEQFANLCEALSDKGIQPVLIGTEAESDVTKHIKNLCPACMDLTAQTSLFDIATLARSAAGAIGNDTGPMHMIGPTGTKTAVLFTRHSNPKRHAPIGEHVVTLNQENLTPMDILKELSF